MRFFLLWHIGIIRHRFLTYCGKLEIKDIPQTHGRRNGGDRMKRRKMAKIAFLATMLVFLGLFNHAAGFAPIMRVIAGSSSIEPDTPHGNFDQLPMFTGTATHRYELQIPPGTNGMAPKLALVYRSTNGNGWFGVGWEMEGLAYIERVATKRVPRYDNSDGYILNMDGLT